MTFSFAARPRVAMVKKVLGVGSRRPASRAFLFEDARIPELVAQGFVI